jgi:serine/threonine protein kinase
MPARIGERYRERYEVLERIGEGAFAQVFRARDLTAGKEVALKVLKDPYLTVKDVVERFQREVFAVASIQSPHVVGLTDFGISDEDFYLVMDLVQGPSLRELLHARPRQLSATDVHTIVGQIAHALKAAHDKEIVHRDLKPENVVLVSRAGGAAEGETDWQVKVLDFGFAKLPELERKLGLEPLTRKGFLFGTPQYLSPEQIRGKPLDGGADLFALAVITYEMMAGRRPWDGDDPREVMKAVIERLPPAVTELHETIAPRVVEVNKFLERGLAKERADRFSDAQQLFEELGRALYPGAIPELREKLDSVSSRSVKLYLGKRRADQTEVTVDEDRATIQFATGATGKQAVPNDTIKSPAFDSSEIVLDRSSGIPIFVGVEQPKTFTSGFYPTPPSTPALRSHDSQRATLPRPSATEQRPPRAVSVGRVAALLVLVGAVAAVAFWLGRVLH